MMKQSSPFERAIEFVLPHETEFERGHYADYAHARTENVPGDGGGLTKFGIDQRSHPTVDIAALTKDQAVAIYRAKYWDAHRLDAFPEPIAIVLFDVLVNGGHPFEWLQRAVNDLDRAMERLKEDGVAGPHTMAALAQLEPAETLAVADSMLKQREIYYERLAESPGRAKFREGWLARNNDLRKVLLPEVVR